MKYLLIALLGISFQAQAQKATDGDLRPLLECAVDSRILIEQGVSGPATSIFKNDSGHVVSMSIQQADIRYDLFNDHLVEGKPTEEADPRVLQNTDPILNILNSAFRSMEHTVLIHAKALRIDRVGFAKIVSHYRDAICTCSKYGIEVEAVRAARKAVLENKEIIFQTINKEQIRIQPQDLACSSVGA